MSSGDNGGTARATLGCGFAFVIQDSRLGYHSLGGQVIACFWNVGICFDIV